MRNLTTRRLLTLLPVVLAAGLGLQAAGPGLNPQGPWKHEDWRNYVTFTVRETAGLARENEPVEVSVRLPSRQVNVVRWDRPPEEVISQVLEAKGDGAAFKMRIIFPATVPARGTARYRIYYGDRQSEPTAYLESKALNVFGESRVGWIVENGHFIADSAARTRNDKPEDPGQVHSLTLKSADITLLRSGGNRMHWAPNFQRAGAGSYTGIARWEPQAVERLKGAMVAETRRAGFHPDYPEIALSAVYRFFAFVPYFWFRSEMRFTKPVELFLLRSDEMTMDGFFTQVAWPGDAPGSVRAATFDEREKILEKTPIPAGAPWVCFFNRDKGYGFGSVRLLFDTRNASGGASPLTGAHTKISDGRDGGKYWNRRLIHEQNTAIPAGSRYAEENAYVVFGLRPGPPEQAIGDFLDWEKKLRKPLIAQMQLSPDPRAKKAR